MEHVSDIRKIAFIGDYLPRKCGIATYTYDLRQSIADQYDQTECTVVPVDDVEDGYEYPPEVRFQIPEKELEGYRRAADFLNLTNVDVVNLRYHPALLAITIGLQRLCTNVPFETRPRNRRFSRRRWRRYRHSAGHCQAHGVTRHAGHRRQPGRRCGKHRRGAGGPCGT